MAAMTATGMEAAGDAAANSAWTAYHERTKAPYYQNRRLWETLWEACDFSWEGLADAGWERGDDANRVQRLKRWTAPIDFPGPGRVHGDGADAWREATLQDYWRWVRSSPSEPAGDGWSAGRLASDDELLALGLLVEIGGTRWHAVHREETILDPGSAAPDSAGQVHQKAAAALLEAISIRLDAATSPKFDYDMSFADTRALLVGARAAGFGPCWQAFGSAAGQARQLHLNASAANLEGIAAGGLWFGDATTFQSASFGDDASFSAARFGNHVDFSFACFGDDTNFQTVTFGDSSHFERTSFGNSSQFAGAKFGTLANFRYSVFMAGVYFTGTLFGDLADFFNASFGSDTSFREAKFGDNTSFSFTDFIGSVSFIDATFGAHGSFAKAKLGTLGLFRSATFGIKADFSSAVFDDAFFKYAVFGDSASFSQTTFREADFAAAKLGPGAIFWAAMFQGPGNFAAAAFSGPVSFAKAQFAGTLSFRVAEIKGYADFTDVAWPASFANQHGVFEGCRFRDVANFKTGDFSAFALFDGAEFKARLLLTEPVTGEAQPDMLFARALCAAEAAVAADRESMASEDYDSYLDGSRGERLADARYAALAGGLRTLKLAMSAQSDLVREHRFYRYELKARRQQPSEPRIVKFVSLVYGLVSDYGASIGRPFLSLAILILAFAAAYWAIGLALGLVDVAQPSRIPQALELSWTNVFKPLSALSSEEMGGGSLGAELLRQGDWAALGVRALATVQSVAAVVLAFLIALAIRRRFQIV